MWPWSYDAEHIWCFIFTQYSEYRSRLKYSRIIQNIMLALYTIVWFHSFVFCFSLFDLSNDGEGARCLLHLLGGSLQLLVVLDGEHNAILVHPVDVEAAALPPAVVIGRLLLAHLWPVKKKNWKKCKIFRKLRQQSASFWFHLRPCTERVGRTTLTAGKGTLKPWILIFSELHQARGNRTAKLKKR